MASIRDVAEKAKVSIATVSRVLNNSENVQNETKLHVQQIMRELKYAPPRVTKTAKQNDRLNIIALVPDISNPFYASVVKGINNYALSVDYNVLLCNTNYDRRIELEHLKILKSKTISGIIFFGPMLTSEEILEINSTTHVVQCGEFIDSALIPHVSINNDEAMHSGMNHLLSLGHRDIALLTCDNSFASTKTRERCYLEMLEQNGCTVDDNYVVKCASYDFKSGMRAMMQLLQLKKRPTAVFAMSDLIAIGAMNTAVKSGVRVPEDIAVVGFDDIEFASICTPTLTTIAQPAYDIGCVAAQMLHQKIVGETIKAPCRFLEHELKIRQSTLGDNGIYTRLAI